MLEIVGSFFPRNEILQRILWAKFLCPSLHDDKL